MSLKKIMFWILALVIIFLVVFNTGGYLFSAPRYNGPISDHFNGKTFVNPGNVKPNGLGDLLKWALNRESKPWIPQTDTEPGPKPENRISDRIRITFVNHATFLIQVDGFNILTDPVWSERVSPLSFIGPRRMRPPGIRYEDLPSIDLVLLSHNHYDHLDAPTMKNLIKDHDPVIITPLGVGAFVQRLGSEKVKDMDWWEEREVLNGLNLICTPAQHFSGRGTLDRDATLWCGFVIARDQGHIYYAGDSGYGSFFKDIGNMYGEMAVSMIPIGAYRPVWFMSPIHMSPTEAVQVHLDVRSRLSIAMHYGTFALADDGQDEPVSELQHSLNSASLLPGDFLALPEGQYVEF